MRISGCADVESYIQQHQGEVREKLDQIRELIRKEVPDAQECISYGMPAYRQRKVLVYFAAASRHIGFYPTSSGIAAFGDRLTAEALKFSKGAIRFPLDKPLPAELIRDIVRFRRDEDANQLPSKQLR